MIDTKGLRRLAQAATPGPWLFRTTPTGAGLCHIVSAADWRGAFIYGDGIRIGVDDALPKAQELAANASLIAAANPATISELLDRLEAAEKECDALRAAVRHEADCVEACKAEIETLRSNIAEMGRQEPVAEWLPLDSGEDTRRD